MSSADMTKDNLRGGMLIAASMAFFAAEDALMKGLTGHIPTGQIILMVTLFSAVVMICVLAYNRVPLFTKDFFQPAVVARNLGETVGGVGFITSLALLPLSMASALFQTLPLVMTCGAALFLGEKVGWRRWTAVGVGFIGVLVILRPTGDGFVPLAALGSALAVIGLAARDLATRKITGNVNSLNLTLWGMMSYLISGVVLMVIFSQSWVSVPVWDLLLIAVTSLLGLFGYYVMIVGTRIGEVSSIMPYRYTRIVFALALGWLFFAEIPDTWMLVGVAMIVSAGLYTFLRERTLSMTRRTR